MNTTLALAACSLLSLLAVIALIREHRLRRALERLLCRILTLWRKPRE